MNPALPDEAVAFGAAAARAFSALGEVDAARKAEADPTMRGLAVADRLAALGVDGLDPRRDGDSLSAAACLCEASGRVALPYPVASLVLADGEGRPFAVVPDGAGRVDHGDLFAEWVVAPLSGPARLATSGQAPMGTRLGPFVTDLRPGSAVTGRRSVGATDADVLLHLALTAFGILGTADQAVALTVEHVRGRVQFGKPIAAFQAVQFQLADAAVAVAGLRELAHFTLWRLATDLESARPDALALRLHAVDVARSVLRTCQQLHGAAGVCDEYDISVLTRMVQPALRLPWSAERTTDHLAAAIREDGFSGLFEHGAVAG